MTKQLFIKTINAIKKQMDHDLRFANYISKAFLNSYPANLSPDNSHLQDALINVLKAEFNDKDNWIQYFIWELNLRKKNKTLKTYDKNKKEIPLSNTSQLYDFLMSQKNQ